MASLILFSNMDAVTPANQKVVFATIDTPTPDDDATDYDPSDFENNGQVDAKDNCDLNRNPDQKDTDRDENGDVCDNDLIDHDEDGIITSKANCAGGF